MSCNDNICSCGVTHHTVRIRSVQRFTVHARFGRKGEKGDPGSGGGSSTWATTIEVPVRVSLVTDDQLKNDLPPIIFISGVSTNWRKAGLLHDKIAGTLDFTGYLYGSEFEGFIDFQY